MRELIHSMVQPIIELARKNIDHNAKKNEKFTEIEKELEKQSEKF